MTATVSFNAKLARDYIIGLLLVPATKGDVQLLYILIKPAVLMPAVLN